MHAARLYLHPISRAPVAVHKVYRSNSGVPRKSQSDEFNASVERLHVLLSSPG
jgi:hypothetical protein